MTNEIKLYQKIHAVMKDVDYLQKDDHISFKSTNYKAISEEKVTSTVRKALLEHGLVILPVEQEHLKVETLTTVNTKYKIVDIETGHYEILASSGTGVDTQDKGVGKAMTYSYKYLLLRTFAIPTGEDPDKVSSAELDAKLNKNEGNGPQASDKQLNLIKKLIKEISQQKNCSEGEAIISLKKHMQSGKDFINYTSQEASKAIGILNEVKGMSKGLKKAVNDTYEKHHFDSIPVYDLPEERGFPSGD